jgi:hypothetical protein
MFELCYKEYPFKMDLGSMKAFKQSTGKCLWSVLIDFLRCYSSTTKMSAIDRMSELYKVVDFETASYVFYHLIDKDANIPLEEIQDSMYRVGWLVNSTGDDAAEPWPIVLAKVAFDINTDFNEMKPEKKWAT